MTAASSAPSTSLRKLQNASIFMQRPANGLQFPSKNCNFFPGFAIYQELTSELREKKRKGNFQAPRKPLRIQ